MTERARDNFRASASDAIHPVARSTYLYTNVFSYALIAIFIVNLLKDFSPLFPVVKGMIYSVTLASVLLLIWISLSGLLKPTRSVAVTSTSVLFCVLVTAWAVVWLLGGGGLGGAEGGRDKWITIAAHPSYSYFSWLIVLIVPASAAAAANSKIFVNNHQYLWIFPLLIVCTIPISYQGAKINEPEIVLAILYMTSVISGRYFLKILALLICTAAMLYTGHRTYVIASIAMIMLISINRIPRNGILAFVLFCFILPFGYYEFSKLALPASTIAAPFTLGRSVFVDTRTFLWNEMIGGMSRDEFVIGRGLDGKYFSRYFYQWAELPNSANGDYYYRSGAEIGWLNIILKFGIVGLSLNLITYITPFLKINKSLTDRINSPYLRFSMVMLLVYTMELPHAADFGNIIWMTTLGGLLRLGPVPTATSLATDKVSRERGRLSGD